MEATAKTKYLKGSPRKARLVIDLIRGQNVSQALSILKFTDKRAAQPIAKCLNSAIANATYVAEKQNIAIDPDDLWVKTCFVDMGPTKNRRRMRPAPQGRAYREQRHYCHITIQVTSEEKAKTEKELKAEAAKAKRAAAPAKEKKKAAKPKQEVKTAKVSEPETTSAVEELAPTPIAETPVETGAVETAEANVEAVETKAADAPVSESSNEGDSADEKAAETSEELEKQ